LFLAAHFARVGVTHVGLGPWSFGGDEPATGRALGTDEWEDVIPEGEYKLHCYVSAAFLLLIGAPLFWSVVRTWVERNELEDSWERVVPNTDWVSHFGGRPELYRDDFGRWLEQNHPSLLLDADTALARSRATAGPNRVDPSPTPAGPSQGRATLIAAGLGNIVVKSLAPLLLFAAVALSATLSNAYASHALLRWIRLVACAASALGAGRATDSNRPGWLVAFVIAALLLSPLGPGDPRGATRALIDGAATALLLLSIAVGATHKTRRQGKAS
jgi:hypothetical protein